MIKLRYPVNYIGITQTYKTGHLALDLGWNQNYGGRNQVVYAPYHGIVTHAIDGKDNNKSSQTDAGNLVRISHEKGYSTRMIHLLKNSITVNVGDEVVTGQIIGRMGDSGYAFGEHLHYDVYLNNVKVDPIDYTYVYDGQFVSEKTKSQYGNNILYYKDESDLEITYIVKKNDTLSQIGRLYNISYQKLAKYNNIANPNLIRVGQIIKIPYSNNYNLTFLLKEGMKDNEVRELQKRLNELGNNLIIDGIFGSKTKRAVIDFQISRKLLVDGIVGRQTANALGWLYKGK